MNAFLFTTLIAANPIFGKVSPPPGVDQFNAANPSGLGIIPFISNMIKVISVVAGLFGLFNIIFAGYTILNSSGNAKAYEQATQQLFMSMIGLAVIVGSFGIAAIVGFLLFGDATYIINPKLPTPGP